MQIPAGDEDRSTYPEKGSLHVAKKEAKGEGFRSVAAENHFVSGDFYGLFSITQD